MKKIYAIITVLILMFIFVGCNSNIVIVNPTPGVSNTVTDETTSDIPNTSNTLTETDSLNDEIGQIIYFNDKLEDYEGQTMRELLEWKTTEDNSDSSYVKITVESDVLSEITLDLCGHSYDFKYVCSGLPQYGVPIDKYIDIYKGKSVLSTVHFDHNTNNIIKLYVSDEWISNLKTHDDFNNVILCILGEGFDINQYQLKIFTNYRSNGEYHTLDGFHEVDVGDEYCSYDFELVRTINGIATDERYEFHFGRDYLRFHNYSNVECYDGQPMPTDGEVLYATKLAEEFYLKYLFSDHVYKQTTLDFIMVYNKRIYLVFEIWYKWEGFRPFNDLDGSAKDADGYAKVYIDYERLQQKMALEGVKP